MNNPLKNIKASNMKSGSGNKIANQFVIDTPQGQIFQSYNSIIAIRSYTGHGIVLDKNYWDYSATTGKYRNMFLGENKKETQTKIDNGTYKLEDLN